MCIYSTIIIILHICIYVYDLVSPFDIAVLLMDMCV